MKHVKKPNDVITDGNLNIKENFKPGFGCNYKEGRDSYNGPTYMQKIAQDPTRKKITLKEYKETF